MILEQNGKENCGTLFFKEKQHFEPVTCAHTQVAADTRTAGAQPHGAVGNKQVTAA